MINFKIAIWMMAVKLTYNDGVSLVVYSRSQSRVAGNVNSTNHSGANGQVSHHIPAGYDNFFPGLLYCWLLA